MGKKDKELTAYCGLYCGDCIRYKSQAATLSHDLSHELKKTAFDKYAKVKSAFVKEFRYYNEAVRVLNAMKNLSCERPCRLDGDGCVQPCIIKKCVQSNGMEGCWQCNQFEGCDKFEFLKPFHGKAPQRNLRKIKRYGLDSWAEHRANFYIWSPRVRPG